MQAQQETAYFVLGYLFAFFIFVVYPAINEKQQAWNDKLIKIVQSVFSFGEKKQALQPEQKETQEEVTEPQEEILLWEKFYIGSLPDKNYYYYGPTGPVVCFDDKGSRLLGYACRAGRSADAREVFLLVLSREGFSLAVVTAKETTEHLITNKDAIEILSNNKDFRPSTNFERIKETLVA